MPTKQQPRNQSGKFDSPYRERRGDAIAMRLPASLDALVRDEAEQRGITTKEVITEILAKHFHWHREGAA